MQKTLVKINTKKAKAMDNFIKVEVKKDHLDKVARASVLDALTEIIWNAFDAVANSVSITIERNNVGLHAVHVKDDGHGIEYKKSKADSTAKCITV